MEFKDRHVVVTGGMGALGAAVVTLLASRGAVCHVPSFTLPKDGAQPDGVHVRGPIDLSSEDQVADYYEGIPELWASVHVAGGFGMSPLTETTLEAFEAQWRLNTVTAFLCCREATRALRRHGGGGRLVNTIARPALEATAGMIAYSVAKAGVAALTTSLAAELNSEAILVNAVAPSIMDTPSNRAAMPDAEHTAWPKVSEVAEAMAFLASPLNTLTHGALMPVYGRL